MNEQEAKDMLQAKLTCLELDSDIEGCDGDCVECEYSYAQGTIREQREAFNIAIKALEKQIPKKPIDTSENPKEWHIMSCPCCGRVFWNSGQFMRYMPKWCEKCGNKIDWTVEE